MRQNTYFVYILASSKNGTLYVGITSNLGRRVWVHQNAGIESFTKKYSVTRLVYFEDHNEVDLAIAREKYIKGKSRQFKLKLINDHNPFWTDLSETLY